MQSCNFKDQINLCESMLCKPISLRWRQRVEIEFAIRGRRANTFNPGSAQESTIALRLSMDGDLLQSTEQTCEKYDELQIRNHSKPSIRNPLR